MHNCQEFYDRVKKHPDAIVKDVGEAHPVIIHEADMLCTLKDGSQVHKTLYVTFEYVKKHLKEFKRCLCEACQGTVVAYRLNKKAMRGEEVEIPDSWIRKTNSTE
jgi:hypothetical protein